MTFDGDTFDPERDGERLARQMRAVFSLMSTGQSWTLEELSVRTGYPEASISARLRDLRKVKFGSHTITRTYVSRGLWTYRLEAPVDPSKAVTA